MSPLGSVSQEYYNTALGKIDPMENKDRFQQAIEPLNNVKYVSAKQLNSVLFLFISNLI